MSQAETSVHDAALPLPGITDACREHRGRTEHISRLARTGLSTQTPHGAAHTFTENVLVYVLSVLPQRILQYWTPQW